MINKKHKKNIKNILVFSIIPMTMLSVTANCSFVNTTQNKNKPKLSAKSQYDKFEIDPGNLKEDNKYWNLGAEYKLVNLINGASKPPTSKGNPKYYYKDFKIGSGKTISGNYTQLDFDKWLDTYDTKYSEMLQDPNHKYNTSAPHKYKSLMKAYDDIYNETYDQPTPKTGNNNNPLDGFYSGAPFKYVYKSGKTTKWFNEKYADTVSGKEWNYRYTKTQTPNGWEHVVCFSHVSYGLIGTTSRKDKDNTTETLQATGDMHNLRPSFQDLFNQPRSNHLYGILNTNKPAVKEDIYFGVGDPWWGSDDDTVCEPRFSIRGDIARITFYMHDRYHVTYDDPNYYKQLILWAIMDPVTKEEKEFDLKAKKVMGFSNEYVTGKKLIPYSQEVYDFLSKQDL